MTTNYLSRVFLHNSLCGYRHRTGAAQRTTIRPEKKRSAAIAGILLGLLLPLAGWGLPITPGQARTAAAQIMSSGRIIPSVQGTMSRAALKTVHPLEFNGQTIGYIADVAGGGFILLRADDQAPPVKLICTNGDFYHLPPQFLEIIKMELAEELTAIATTAPATEYNEQWQALASAGSTLPALGSSASVGPLLTSQWDQGAPYNLYSPTAANGPGGRAWAGCVATALGQILYYHQWPPQVLKDMSYTDNSGSCKGTHALKDVGLAAYNWAIMADQITSQTSQASQKEIARLIYHCGVAEQMNFEAGGSGAGMSENPLIQIFDLTATSMEDKATFSDADWYSKIATSIDAQKPVWYAMYAADWSAGHSVVCDGYRNGNEIHLNLGWSGYGNAWYNMDIVKCSYTWTRHFGLFNIAPNPASKLAPAYTLQPQGGSYLTGPGNNITLEANVKGNPRPFVQWYKDGKPLAGQTNNTLQINSYSAQDAGTYSQYASNTLGTAQSSDAIITVSQPCSITIQQQPASMSCLVANTYVLAVQASSSTPLTYQWYKNDQALSGAVDATLGFSNIQLTDAGRYYVRITDSTTNIQSSTAIITVLGVPVMTLQPQSVTVATGKPFTLTAGAVGKAPMTYQWQKNGVPIASATQYKYTCAAAQAGNAGTYNVIVKNSDGNCISDDSTVTVIQPVAITTQPAAKTTVIKDRSVTLTVKASGQAPLSYQWYCDNALSGQTASTCTISNLDLADSGNYWVVISNAMNCVTSTVAKLTVIWPPTLTVAPTNNLIKAEENVTFTAAAQGKDPLTYIWKRGTTVVGDNHSTLALTGLDASDAGSYTVTVTNSDGSVTSKAAILTLGYPPTITQQPTNITPLFGGNGTLSLVVTGSSPITTQWYTNATPVTAGKLAKFTLAKVSLETSGDYFAIVSNKWGMATSSVANVNVRYSSAIKQGPASVTIGTNQSTTLKVVAAGKPPLSYQWQFNGTNIDNATETNLAIGPASLNDAGKYTVTVSNIDGAVTSAPAIVKVLVGPVITKISDALTVTNGGACNISVTATSAVSMAYQWFRNDEAKPIGTAATLKLSALQPKQAGTYTVRVTNLYGFTSGTVSLTVLDPPVIKTQPVGKTVGTNQNYTLTVGVTGESPFFYQWQLNGTNIANATNNNYLLSFPTLEQAGAYTVVVTNADGVATSKPALIAIGVGPVITSLSSATVTTNGSACSLSATATGTGTLGYHWYLTGSDKIVGSTATLKLTGIQPSQAGTYRVDVTNVYGIVSGTVELTVKQPPVITLQPINTAVSTGQPLTLKVAAKGADPLTYQWQKDSANLDGATNATLQIASTSTNNIGTYIVTISNHDGVVQSRGAVVTLKTATKTSIDASALARIASAKIDQDQFTLVIKGAPQQQMTIEAQSTFGKWIPLGQIILNDNGEGEFHDPLSSESGVKLYRIGANNL